MEDLTLMQLLTFYLNFSGIICMYKGIKGIKPLTLWFLDDCSHPLSNQNTVISFLDIFETELC